MAEIENAKSSDEFNRRNNRLSRCQFPEPSLPNSRKMNAVHIEPPLTTSSFPVQTPFIGSTYISQLRNIALDPLRRIMPIRPGSATQRLCPNTFQDPLNHGFAVAVIPGLPNFLFGNCADASQDEEWRLRVPQVLPARHFDQRLQSVAAKT